MSATLEQVDLVGAALRYARAGRGVFPVHTARDGACSCPAGEVCENAGKHPRTRRGWHDASVDPQVIAGWWERWPDANVGMVTGGRLGVLDVDPRSGGDESFAELHQRDPLQDGTPTVRTGSGGSHYFVTVPAGTRTTVLATGLDLKADGGYVIAPPSLHACGDRYRWVLEGRATPAPSWALNQDANSPRTPPRPRSGSGCCSMARGPGAATPRRRGSPGISPAATSIRRSCSSSCSSGARAAASRP